MTWWPPIVIIIASVTILLTLRYLLFRRKRATHTEHQLGRQLLMFVLTAIAVVLVILALPIGDTARGQLLSLLGLLATAAIALSSTTFVGNAMAGFMLRAVENFQPGDFVRVGDHFGRVSERGLLHTEIQTEDRDLTTLPNLYLVTNPVTVVRSSGTVISATVSLGYDVSHITIIKLLKEAGEAAKLKETFVLILELGDFSVTYRVAGFLEEVKTLISARSRLRSCMLNVLHKSGIEIVSPAFMNQKRVEANQKFIPALDKAVEQNDESPEGIIFDKAEEAESKENLLRKLEEIQASAEKLKEALKETKSVLEKEHIEKQLDRLTSNEQELLNTIQMLEE